MSALSVASFNTHAGMDLEGAPYDLVEACRMLDADVIALQEVFTPETGPSQAAALAGTLGYRCVELALARAWRADRPRTGPLGLHAYGRPHIYPLQVGVLTADRGANPRAFEPGTWGIAVLSRVPVADDEAFEFAKLGRDYTRRGALRVRVELPGAQAPDSSFTVIATHAPHITAGSHVHFRHLRSILPAAGEPVALAGDMNLWGPAVSAMLPGWSRAVRGRTWPAGRPHSQLDHIFITRAVRVVSGKVMRLGTSDHCAVRAELAWGS